MVGPVLNLELTLAGRRGRHAIFRWIYAAWLLLLLAVYLVMHYVLAAAWVLHHFTEFLIVQHFILILLVTPTFTAGAITDEKGRGTLQDLLTAGLTSWEIVIGKLLGRLAQVAALLLTALPVLCFIGVFGGLDPTVLVALVLTSGLALFAVAAASLLASVWTRETRTAVLGVFVAVALLFAATVVLAVDDFVSPLYVLEPAWGGADLAEFGRRFLIAGLVWGGLGVSCLALAVWRLRAAYVRQLEAARPRERRWWPVRRAPVGDDPIRWRERQVEGLAPLPILRAVPRGLGLLAVFGLATLAGVGIVLAHLPSDVAPADVPKMLLKGEFVKLGEALRDLRDPGDAFFTLNLGVLAAATLVVGIRCSGAVSREREGRTWEALLLTPLPTQAILRGKLWAILGAAWPYLAAYAVPALLFSLLGRFWSVFPTAVLIGITVLATIFVGCAGLWCSVVSRSSWRSLAGTMAFTYVGGAVLFFFLSCPMSILSMMLFLALTSLLKAVDRAAGTGVAGSVGGSSAWAYCYVICTGLALVAIAFGLAWFFLLDAEKRVADRERTRHWRKAHWSPRRKGPATSARPYR
jgi:ABC-type transport system involved in multi-copper enzyme maturation permease subunit